jgi:hypothetical protein
MIFTSKHSLELSKNAKEVTAFFKNKTGVEIEKKSLLENTVYSLEHDYDRFILSKKPRPLTRNGFLEVQLYLNVTEIDEQNSKVEYSIKYSALSVLIIVTIYLIFIAVILFTNNIRIFGNSTTISIYLTKTLILILNLSLITTVLWLHFLNSQKKLQEVFNEIKKSIHEKTTDKHTI